MPSRPLKKVKHQKCRIFIFQTPINLFAKKCHELRKLKKLQIIQIDFTFFCESSKKKAIDKKRMRQEIDLLRRECENLQTQISSAQDQLPETGIPLSKSRCDKIHREFADYVAQRTENNFKFWPFSLVVKSLFESYTVEVNASDMNKLNQTSLKWVQNNCK